jgi:hypothetical protein
VPIATTAALVLGGAAALSAGASVYASNKAASAQKKAAAQSAQAQTEASDKAIAAENARFEQIRGDLAPYRDQGAKGFATYADLVGANGPEAQMRARGNFRTDPGYEFAVNEGNRAIQGSAAARRGLLSGGTLKALQERGQGLADQQYGSYLDRFLNLGSIGQNAAAQTGNFGAQSSGRVGQYITGAGQAQAQGYLDAGAAKAGGYLGAAQGVTGAINNSLSLYGYGKGQGWWDSPASGGYSYWSNPI